MLRIAVTTMFVALISAQANLSLPAIWFGVEIEQQVAMAPIEGLDLVYTEVPNWDMPYESEPQPQAVSAPKPVVVPTVSKPVVVPLAPKAKARLDRYQGWLRLVVYSPEALKVRPRQESYGRTLQIELPFVPELEDSVAANGLNLAFATRPKYGLLRFSPPAGRLRYYRSYTLRNPARYVLEIYYLQPEVSQPVAPGMRYREFWVWTPEPKRLYVLEAASGSWRLDTVGFPGARAMLPAMAPRALAVLNGSYFDPRTSTPIGLWVKNGTTLNLPYGRSALLWQGGDIWAEQPNFAIGVVAPSGKSYPVGVNLWKARYTIHTTPGKVGMTGRYVHVVQRGKVVSTLPGSTTLKPGQWAITYPVSDKPIVRTGQTLKLNTTLRVDNVLEAGPVLLREGKVVFNPKNESFRDKNPLFSTAPQSAVAWSKKGTLMFIVSDPMTPAVLAKALLKQGVWGAIRMDGGGSSQLWVKGKLRSPAGARPVVNGLALYPR